MKAVTERGPTVIETPSTALKSPQKMSRSLDVTCLAMCLSFLSYAVGSREGSVTLLAEAGGMRPAG